MSISSLEDEKHNILNTSKEELEKQDNELKQKDFIIKSLEEKLNTVEGYVQSLESNSLEVILIIMQKFSVSLRKSHMIFDVLLLI